MKQTIFAATAAAVVALGATFASAQSDQTQNKMPRAGEHHARPEASMNQPQNQPQPAQTRQAQPAQSMAQPGQQPQQAGDRERNERNTVSQAQRTPPNTQAQPNRQSPATAERGTLSQERRNPQTFGERERTERGQAATMPNAQLQQREQMRTTSERERFQGRTSAQALHRNERREATPGFGSERPGFQLGVGINQRRPEATERFGAERFGTERFGGERFGAERFGVAPERGEFRVGVAVTERQRTELRERLAAAPLHRVAHFGFTVSVGAVVPRAMPLYPLPATVAAVVPQFRGYRYVADQQRIVIVQPQTYRVVAVLPMGEGFGYGSSTPPHGFTNRCS